MHPAPVALARISHLVLLLLVLAALASAQENNVRPLIVQAVDDSQLTTLKGNTHPLARAEAVDGRTDDRALLELHAFGDDERRRCAGERSICGSAPMDIWCITRSGPAPP